MTNAGSTAPQLTQEIARFVVGMSRENVPARAFELAALGALDGTAVMLAGRSEEATRIVHEYVEALGTAGASSVAGSHLKTHPAAAALVNGTSAHAHDFDDTQISASPDHVYGLMTHPTASIWAAALAVAEPAHASGEDTLLAYLAGIEVACRICDAITSFHYVRGFHTTQTIAVFGATAAACRLLKLSVAQTQCALGLATSMAAGIRINFGTMAKPLHAGRAAESGVVAAQLAKRGMTARLNALEDPGGFFKTFAGSLDPQDPVLVGNPLWGYLETGTPGFEPQRIAGRLGRDWYIESPGLSVKPFPSVVLSHPSMFALLDLLETNDIAASEIEKIVVHAGSTVLNIMYRIPETGTQGKFSLVFCLALIALKRGARIADFTDDHVRSPEALAMMHRIELLPAEDDGVARLDTMYSRIRVQTKNGRAVEKAAGAYKGGPDNPLTDKELDAKFMQCATQALPEPAARQALAAARRLPEMNDIRELTAALVPASNP
ncbi:MAG TPA: MmgE/PrpD family protein [Ramlibacter sp.]|nr:MmgE/PrpD family protein [Ramlibacter sp.]